MIMSNGGRVEASPLLMIMGRARRVVTGATPNGFAKHY
jgi:hypothetical protein